jgi:transposase
MTYSIDIINVCITKFNNNISVFNMAKMLEISHTNIYTWLAIYKDNFYNHIYITPEQLVDMKKNTLHKSNKINKYEEQICTYVNNNNGCSLNDILANLPDMNLSKSSICRVLKKNNITHKRFKTRIIGKDVNLIEADRTNIANILTHENYIDMISIDEMPIRVEDLTNYGYSKSGVEIKKVAKHKFTKKRLTLLKAISKDQIIGYQILESSVNTNVYLNFLKKITDKLVGKTILHDNVRFHHAKLVKAYCNENNINLQYTPAYSPEFNPIETVFSEIKSKYRTLTHINMVDDIKVAIESLVPSNFINNYEHSFKFINTYKTV